MESTFGDGSNGTPLVGGEVFGVKRRDLERVAFRDFIVVLVLDDCDGIIESNTLFLDRPFVGGEWGVFLAREGGGRSGIARVVVIVIFGFGGFDVVGGAVCVGNRMGATHFGRSCFVGGFAGVGNPGLVVLGAFLLDECKETRDRGGLLLRSQGRASALKIAWSLVGALLGRVGVRSSCRISVSQVVRSCSIDV